MAKIGKTTKKPTANVHRVVSAVGRNRDTTDSSSPTAVAAEAMATGVVARESGRRRVPSFPDQSQVDLYGRAMGVSEEDSGALRTSSELLDSRDRHRGYQDVPEDHSKE